MSRKSYEPAGSSLGAEYHRRTQDAVRGALFWKEMSQKLEKKLFEFGQERTHLLLLSVCTILYIMHVMIHILQKTASVMYYNYNIIVYYYFALCFRSNLETSGLKRRNPVRLLKML